MIILSYATRKELQQLGLSTREIDILNDLRTQYGKLEVTHFSSPPKGIREETLKVLKELLDETEKYPLSASLALTLTPDPPKPAQNPAILRINYHSNIDREYRTYETAITLRGQNHLTIYDISADYLIEVEILEVTEKEEELLLMSRAMFKAPPNLQESPTYYSGTWNVTPSLDIREHVYDEGTYISASFFFDTVQRKPVDPIAEGIPTRIHRTGLFQVLGQPHFRFDAYTFAAGFPNQRLFEELPSVFENHDISSFSRFEPFDPTLIEIRKRITFEKGELDFEGAFELGPIEREGIKAHGWVWILSGPDVLVGFEPDKELYIPRSDILITLPGQHMVSGEEGSVPFNATEQSMLDRPELFGGDPGASCRPFDQPGRVLSERRFTTALRVTQPDVEDAEDAPFYSNDVTVRPVDYPRRKRTANKSNVIEYEDSQKSAKYQAKTVAIGHIIETAVRYRSNGYSLGDILYSLTLAPRQKRQIVKFSYSRRDVSSRIEDTLLQDEPADSLDRSRDYDNAVNASLDEWAKGNSSSKTTSGAVGLGFAKGGFIFGGGAATSNSRSSSSQNGGRRVTASETQQLRDSIRRWGEATRSLQTTVITETEQTESTEGVSEVIQNINYTRSLSVIYYEILRHLRLDTEIAGVSECIFVPLPIKHFDLDRVKRYRDILRRYTTAPEERLAFTYLDYLPDKLGSSGIPAGARFTHPLRTLSGSIWIRMGLGMPGEGEVAEAISAATDKPLTSAQINATLQKHFGFYTPFLGSSISGLLNAKFAADPEERNRYFQSKIAPNMARRFIDNLVLVTGANNPLILSADFTLATAYRFGSTLKVDFTVDLTNTTLTRENLQKLTIRFGDNFMAGANAEPEYKLPANSFMDVTQATLSYANEYYQANARSDRGARDLVSGDSGKADPNGALLSFTLSQADRRDIHALIKNGYDSLIARLEARTFFYHKAVWWSMDRDELFTLLDGYALSQNDPRSIASVIQREPLGIVGNSLVFRTSTDKPLDPMFKSFEALKNHYIANLKPTDPMRISLPTDGVYARAHLDSCIAAEEHNGSFDWVFDNVEPELAGLPDNMFNSRWVDPQNLTPTTLPGTIINLQNAPEAPAPSGFNSVLGAVQNANAFRDMAGLTGTQANTLAGLQTAAGLASEFGNLASQGAIAQLQADAKAGSDLKSMMDALKKGVEQGMLSADKAKESAELMAKRRAAGGADESDKLHRQELEKTALDGSGGGEVSTTTKDGTHTVTKNPEPEKAPTKPHPGYVKWLTNPDGRQELLLYNFKVGSLNPELSRQHIEALHTISKQIDGVSDIDRIEGRASATLSKSDENPEQKNERLSITRMELVWMELMRYARDPQSNLEKQIYLSHNDPIRSKYSSELASIDSGTGGEDPIERSVLIRLTRKVIPTIKAEVVIKRDPEACKQGHTFVLNDLTFFEQENNFKVEVNNNIEEVNIGDTYNLSGGSTAEITNIKDNQVTIAKNITNNTINYYMSGASNPGTINVTADSGPTKHWHIDITNPRASGVTPDDFFQFLISTLRAASNSTVELASIVDFKVPGVAGVIKTLLDSTGKIKTLGKIANELLDVLEPQDSIVRKSLQALKIGTVEVDVRVTAKSATDPNKTRDWDKKNFTLSGEGIYYAYQFEHQGATTENVIEFDYETNNLYSIQDWESRNELKYSLLKFYRGLSATDFIDSIRFVTELANLIVLSAPASNVLLGAQRLLELIDQSSLKNYIDGKKGLTFKPKEENEINSSDLRTGHTVTLFELKNGLFRLK